MFKSFKEKDEAPMTLKTPEPTAPTADLTTTQKGWILLQIYFKAMVFAFTGGLAATPQLIHDITKKHQLLSEDEYLEIIALASSLPGIIGVNNAYFTGKRVAGNFGAFMAISGTVFPALISMLLAAMIFRSLPESRIMRGAINGIRAVSIAVLLQTGINIIQKQRKLPFAVVMILVAFLLPLLTPLSAFTTILICGFCGIIYVIYTSAKATKGA